MRLGETFDAVFVHDAVAYITSEADLTIATAAEHVRPGGVALFVPDYVRERFEPHTGTGGHADGADRGLRYLEWVWDPDPSDTTYISDFAYLLRDEGGEVRCEQDRHVCGLFPRATWVELIEGAGLRAESHEVPPDEEPAGAELFVGVRVSLEPGREELQQRSLLTRERLARLGAGLGVHLVPERAEDARFLAGVGGVSGLVQLGAERSASLDRRA